MAFAFNDDAAVKVVHVGRRRLAVTRIDNVLHHPEEVAALGFAQTHDQDRSNFYPGMRAPMPEGFSAAFRSWLARIPGSEFRRETSYFSVVTTASPQLLPIQRIPHYDSTDPGLFAAVIYLCDSRFSGTSFYRHSTAPWSIPAECCTRPTWGGSLNRRRSRPTGG